MSSLFFIPLPCFLGWFCAFHFLASWGLTRGSDVSHRRISLSKEWPQGTPSPCVRHTNLGHKTRCLELFFEEAARSFLFLKTNVRSKSPYLSSRSLIKASSKSVGSAGGKAPRVSTSCSFIVTEERGERSEPRDEGAFNLGEASCFWGRVQRCPLIGMLCRPSLRENCFLFCLLNQRLALCFPCRALSLHAKLSPVYQIINFTSMRGHPLRGPSS